ncbi:MAG: hypothetical protein MK085_04125 [Phycisphaerales bacterium]|nr:hypothetical protein [Phycisphaerales bacterium]
MLSTLPFVLTAALCAIQDAPPAKPTTDTAPKAAEVVEIAGPIDAEKIARAIERSGEILVERQEGPDDAEWPYEGVYRVRGTGPRAFIRGGRIIPMGYRVGGTSIAGMSLLRLPNVTTQDDVEDAEAAKARAALERARAFVVEATGDSSLKHDYPGGYDVRGWGYIYGVRFLMAMDAAGLVAESDKADHAKAVTFYLDGIRKIEIPKTGGWNYARRGPLDASSPASPFMTAPALQALFEAQRAGLEFDKGMVERGLKALDNNLTPEGHVAYSAARPTRENPEMLPGAIGRMVAVETVRSQAGLDNAEDLRRALAAFFEHWEELEKRRSKNGTHEPPYGVAPYYFFYGHGYAAEAIEQLPEDERAAWREKLLGRLFEVREKDDSWNDRVFKRSKAYGTSIALQVLTQPDAPPAARFSE